MRIRILFESIFVKPYMPIRILDMAARTELQDKPMKRKLRALHLMISLLAASLLFTACDYELWVFSHDPERAFNGFTFIHPMLGDNLLVVDMAGAVVAESASLADGIEFEVLENGNILELKDHGFIYTRSMDGGVQWAIPAKRAHHSVLQMPNGHIMVLYDYELESEGWDRPLLADGILEVNPITRKIIWVWKAGDHLSTDDFCPLHFNPPNSDDYYDWTHSNTIIYQEEESAVYLNVRNLDRILKIDYPSGEILWSMGDGGDFGEGLFSHPSDPELLANGNFLMYDNGNHRLPRAYSRAVEIAFDPVIGWAEVVWDWPREPLFFDSDLGDANRLPNGNTLITSSQHGRIFEVTRNGDVVWDLLIEPVQPFMQTFLCKSERVLSLDPFFKK